MKPDHSSIEIPESLRQQLLAYRRRVWTVKLIEAAAIAVIGVLAGFLLIFVIDRLFDTPWLVRGLILAAAVWGCAAIPLALRRWVWRRRKLEQLARLLSRIEPRLGQPLLGVIELAASESEQARSPALGEAAIGQVAGDMASRDLQRSTPPSRHRRSVAIAALLAGCTLLVLLATRPAAVNAWSRFLAPWRDTPRYTFVSMQDVPRSLVVPHGEAFDLEVALASGSSWRPEQAEARLPDHGSTTASQQEGRYRFELPGQLESTELGLRVGDFVDRITVQPVPRPELTALEVEIELPEYLGRDQRLRQAIRGSSMTAVRGSRLAVQAQASRKLASASVNGQARPTEGAKFSSEPVLLNEQVEFDLAWRDEHQLPGKDDFTLTIEAVEDQPPSVRCDEMPGRRRLLDSDVVTFRVTADDDFGVKRVGYEWEGLKSESGTQRGERIIGAGGPEVERLELAGTFSAEELGIEPQPVSIRVFVEDHLPGRPRVYASEHVLQIVPAQQHANWIADQLQRWHRMSMDVRDRERQLHERNRELRELSDEELDDPEVRHELLRQATQERDGARQLNELVRSGEDLLREAMRNPETPADSVNSMAAMMQSLNEIADNRMPSVADLLQEASQAASVSGSDATGTSEEDKSESSAQAESPVGKNRLQNDGSGEESPADEPAADGESEATSPKDVTDIESTQRKIDAAEEEQAETQPSPPSAPQLSLPSTMVAGTEGEEEPSREEGRAVDDAVLEQAALLAEFDQVADDLATVMDRLEGSTFVKRLKAASRAQQQVATSLSSIAASTFGVTSDQNPQATEIVQQLARRETAESEKLADLRDDMKAFYARSRSLPYRTVLQQMREDDVIGGLDALSAKLAQQSGLAIALAEYWSDTLDRWADDLVPVAESDSSEEEETSPEGSLPPAILLEVLRVLDAEVKLREQTRVAEQARPAVSPQKHIDASRQLAEQQRGLRQRIDDVVEQLDEFADEEIDFADEASLLSTVGKIMGETTTILSAGETGPPAIAAETEAIELMLQSNRFNPSGGSSGGGGSSPGGGNGGTTDAEALAMVGIGAAGDKLETETPTTHATGRSGVDLPEEFRNGLNEYFNQVERWRSR